MLRLRSLSVPLLLTLTAGATPIASATAQTTAKQAERKALIALDVRAGSAPVVVFRQPGTVAPRAVIREAGVTTVQRARATRGTRAALRRAGVTTVAAPRVVRAGDERSWMFYEDQAPYQAYQHPGRVVLVGVDSGRVTVSRTLRWPPLIAGRLPAFLRDYDAYRSKRYRVFVRSWRLRDEATSRAVASGSELLVRGTTVFGPTETTLDPDQRALARATAPGASSAHQRAADRLANERSCVLRISDTLGDFYDAGPVDRTRAEFGSAFVRLARQNAGFHTARYRYRDGRTPSAFVRRAIEREGCRDVLIYVGGGGYRSGKPAVNVGTRANGRHRIDQQLVTASDLRAIARAHRGVSFKLVIDAPYSGAFLPALRHESNVVLLLTSSGPRESSFVSLGSVVDRSGRPVENRYNQRRYLEFTNRMLEGLQCFLSSADEVDAARAAQDAGRIPSFLAWMVDRAFSICADGSLADRVEGAPTATVFRRGPVPTSPTPTPAPVPAAPTPSIPAHVNRAPVAAAASVSTDEDTPVTLTLAGHDPDGDPLSFSIVSPPARGSLSGDGATRTYTPDPDANGTDTLTFTVSDGQATSAPATVTIEVAPVNDAPTVTEVGDVTFVEGKAPVAVAPAARLSDVDDTELEGATVRLTAGFVATEDQLAFVDQNGISGDYDGTSGTLTLTGTASIADYQAALRSVTYGNASADPSDAARTVEVTADDGELQSVPASGPITLEPVNDAPVLGGGGNTVTFPEDDVDGVVINPDLTVTDVDSTTLSGATVRIATGLVAAEDRLSFTDQAGISGSYDAAAGTLTLSGNADLAAYQAALRSVRYRNLNSGQPSTTPRTVEFTVDDGAAQSNISAAIISTVEVDPSDDAPVVTLSGAIAAYVEGAAAVAIDPGLTVVDVDDATLTGATVEISAGFVPAEDRLEFTDTATITGSYESSSGVLTLTGAASVADYQSALRAVRYRNVDEDDPSPATRTIRFTVANALTSDPVTVGVTVTPVNDAPVVTTSGGSAAFVEDGPAVVVDPGVTVSDVDDATLSGATVQLGSALLPQDGELAFVDTAAILGSWDPGSRTLTLSGTASVADYQAALRSVTFADPSDTPDPTARSVTFTVTDTGAATSAPATRTVTVTATDDPPTLTAGGGTPIYQEGDPALPVDPGLLVVDPDSATLTGATVSIGTGLAAAEDELVYAALHGITGDYATSTGVLTLSGTATVAEYQAALRSVAYRNASADPSTADRVISFTVDDASSTSASVTTTLRVVAVNTPPTLGGGGNVVHYAEGDPATVVNAAITVDDVDDTQLDGATVTISAGLASAEDRLEFTDQNGISGAFEASTGTLTLTGTATIAAYQTALRSVRYRNANGIDPATDDRTVRFIVADSDAQSEPATSTIEVTSVPDAPTVTTSGGSVTFVEGGPPVVVDDGITVADPDSTELSGATVSITGGFSAAQGDVLGFNDQSGITGSYAAATGVLTLTGAASLADYESALRSVTFANASDDPTSSRTITFVVNDESSTASVPSTRTIAIDPVNDAPALSGGGTLSYTENDPATAISPTLAVADPDDAALAGATVAISAGLVDDEDRLRFTNQSGISGSYDVASGVLTLSGTAAVADYQAALRSVAYENQSDDPSDTTRTITYTARDAGSPALDGSTTATVAVTPVNDAPTAPDVTLSGASAAIGNTVLVGDDPADAAPDPAGPRRTITSSLRTGATDPDSGDLTVVPGTFATNDGGSVTLQADGDFVYTPKTGTSCTDASDYFDYEVVDDDPTAPLSSTGRVTVAIDGCVWYVDNDAAADGDGSSATPFDTLAEADAAATTAGATIYVYRGDGTSDDLGGGVTLATDQRLIGAARDLEVGGTTLVSGADAQRPSIAGSVQLASGNTVEGLAIAAPDGRAIDGGSGDDSGTLRDLRLTASGSSGRALSLSSTSGTWSVSDVRITTTGGAAGIVAADAGTVDFAGAGTISVVAAGPGITISGTTLGGTIDSTTVTAPAATGIALTDTDGGLTLDDLSLTTTGTGLMLDGASGITVRTEAGADGDVVSGGTAVDVTGAPTVGPRIDLTEVSSSGGAYGIRLQGLGTGTFSASGGTLGGQTAAALSVEGGSGDISYGGAIDDGSGLSVRVVDRTGGAVTVSGSITDSADAGGGIELSGSTGGSTAFTGTSKVLSTGAQPAVDLTLPGGHDVAFTGGGLSIAATSGAGFRASGSGSVAVTGSGNAIVTTTGRALQIHGPDLAAAGATFRSISSTGAPSGIQLNATGSAGGLTVTGTGTAGSGGTITGSTGPGIELTDAAQVSLSRIVVTNGADDGIRATRLNGLQLVGSSVTGNGNGSDEHGLDLRELAGTATITDATVTGNAASNLVVENEAANLASLTVTGGTFGLNHESPVGNDSILIRNTGSGTTTAKVSGVTFDRSRGDHVQVTTDASNTSVQNVTIADNAMTGDGTAATPKTLGGGVTINPAGAAQTTVAIRNNTIVGAYDSAIVVSSPAASTAQIRATITGNQVGTVGQARSGSASGDGIYVNGHGASTITALIADNAIRQWNNAFGIDIVQNDGPGSINATVTGNTLTAPGPSALSGMRLTAGGVETDTGTSCYDIGHATDVARRNQLAGTGVGGAPDVRLRMAGGAGSTLRLPGYGGGAHDGAAVGSYLAGRNTITTAPTVVATQYDATLSFVGGGSCPQP